jgi:DNA polymerase I-like protein with 3'-5' exonuclease and polymerase domains/Pyruvate/2-oxoacid:ferredoxin oxidoreductase delta subunit
MSLNATIKLTHEVLHAVLDMERAGIAIDTDALDKLEKEYTTEQEQLEKDLYALAREAMGDRPYNLNSPEQLGQILFSRRVLDKEKWSTVFNLGQEQRGAGMKKKRPTRYPKQKFNAYVRGLTDVIRKTKQIPCVVCAGSCYTVSTDRKRKVKCKACKGSGVGYENCSDVAGFKLVPLDAYDLTSSGFATNADKLEEYIERTNNGKAKEFLKKMVRLNAVSTYLSTFVRGIREAIRPDGLVHTSFMQAITATGRLSSQAPNFHNQPRGNTFPVRRCIVSRWASTGGLIAEVDKAQLEFRVAVELAYQFGLEEKQGLQDILDAVDVHNRTASILTSAGRPTTRQDAKPFTFKPLYGGTSGTEAEQTYFKSFLERYNGIARTQELWCDTAISTGIITLPSGREYEFKGIRRYPNGGVSGSTRIKNYPVQGFATGDIVPALLVQIAYRFKQASLLSLIINEIHDSIVVDVYPGELDLVTNILWEVCNDVHNIIFERYGVKLVVPYACEVKYGPNMLEMKQWHPTK